MASPESSSVDLNSVSGSSELGETVTNALSQLRRAQESDFVRRRVVASHKGKNKTQRGPGKTSQQKSTSLKYVSVNAIIREFKEEPFRKSKVSYSVRPVGKKFLGKQGLLSASSSLRSTSPESKDYRKRRKEMLIVDAMKNYGQEGPS